MGTCVFKGEGGFKKEFTKTFNELLIFSVVSKRHLTSHRDTEIDNCHLFRSCFQS